MLIRKLRLLLKINAFDLERFEFKFLNREGTLSRENLLSVFYEILFHSILVSEHYILHQFIDKNCLETFLIGFDK